MGCSSTTSTTTNKAPIVRVPTKITSYPLKDYKGVEHKYRDNFDRIFGNAKKSEKKNKTKE